MISQHYIDTLSNVFHAFELKLSMIHFEHIMNLKQTQHIQALLALPEIADAWHQEYGFIPTEEDEHNLTELYATQVQHLQAMGLQ